MFDSAALATPFAGAYPERNLPRENWLDRFGVRAAGPVARWLQARRLRAPDFVRLVDKQGDRLRRAGDDELTRFAQVLRQRLRRSDVDQDEVTAQSFALVREVAQRRLQMRHYDVQLIGGRILLHGMLAEMEAGEGKTLTATLPACTAALAGLPVHIVTVNDYLATRDTELMKPVYQALGLSVGTIVGGMSPEDRRKAYACDITYCTNKEVAFDFLKDRITLGQKRSRAQLQLERLYGDGSRLQRLLLRGLCFAIVDEADSVLIDEARTPLIISGAGDVVAERELYEQALALAGQLQENADFRIHGRERRVELTGNGKQRIESLAHAYGGIWSGTQRREELARHALAARYLYLRDQQYLVKDGEVQIIDEYTGRAMPDRAWEQGLHQMIETKEQCEVTHQRETLARMSYQNFFRRYLHLAGMSGTAQEVAGELWSVYRMNVIVVPPNKPIGRVAQRTEMHLTSAQKWRAIAEHVANVNLRQRPILIGTRSVEASEKLSAILTQKRLHHQVLNARQDESEASIVARAGEFGCITVATNMAGRGTDILLAPGVELGGGLHVVITELHEARRIDRQLSGRCGRQGDPGTYKAVLSLEDELPALYVNRWLIRLAAALIVRDWFVSRWIFQLVMRLGQASAERLHAGMRRDLLKMDEQLDTALAFSGQAE